MKKHLFCVISTLFILLVTGCDVLYLDNVIQQQKQEQITLSEGQKSSIEIAAGGGVASIKFASNLKWTVVVNNGFSSDPWLTVSPTSGSAGNAIVLVSVSKNTTSKSRSGVILIKSGEISQSIEILQEPGDGSTDPIIPEEPEKPQEPEEVIFKASRTTIDNAAAEGAAATVTITTNVDYQVICSADWITENLTKVTKVNVHTFFIAKNPSSEPRSAIISFVAGENRIDIPVNQKGAGSGEGEGGGDSGGEGEGGEGGGDSGGEGEGEGDSGGEGEGGGDSGGEGEGEGGEGEGDSGGEGEGGGDSGEEGEEGGEGEGGEGEGEDETDPDYGGGSNEDFTDGKEV